MPTDEQQLWESYYDAKIKTADADYQGACVRAHQAGAELERLSGALFGAIPEVAINRARFESKQSDCEMILALRRVQQLQAAKALVLAIPDERRMVSVDP